MKYYFVRFFYWVKLKIPDIWGKGRFIAVAEYGTNSANSRLREAK
jgi:hypothetical protein